MFWLQEPGGPGLKCWHWLEQVSGVPWTVWKTSSKYCSTGSRTTNRKNKSISLETSHLGSYDCSFQIAALFNHLFSLFCSFFFTVFQITISPLTVFAYKPSAEEADAGDSCRLKITNICHELHNLLGTTISIEISLLSTKRTSLTH